MKASHCARLRTGSLTKGRYSGAVIRPPPEPATTASQPPPLHSHQQPLEYLTVAQIRDIVFDSRHPASAARFWAAALEGYDIAPYDQAELDRLHAAGIDDPEDDPAVLVQASSPGTPRLWFQLVPESKAVKNRVHLDLTCADVNAEAERLARLGAHVLAEQETWVTMADPEGNEFDVMQG
jgi:hypothetical protein